MFCLQYENNMKKKKWTKIADIIEYRYNAACTVFGGKIVVTGGKFTNSVEAYDYYENKWTYLPDMIYERFDHAAFSMVIICLLLENGVIQAVRYLIVFQESLL